MAGNFDGGYVAQMRQPTKDLGAYFVTARSPVEYNDLRYDGGKDTR
ncbi:MAG: hypothetical protein JWQ75_2169 [Pseudarthrobacter sp.]|nr:hypothetical protein [Pseudarthrobacter sp.]